MCTSLPLSGAPQSTFKIARSRDRGQTSQPWSDLAPVIDGNKTMSMVFQTLVFNGLITSIDRCLISFLSTCMSCRVDLNPAINSFFTCFTGLASVCVGGCACLCVCVYMLKLSLICILIYPNPNLQFIVMGIVGFFFHGCVTSKCH